MFSHFRPRFAGLIALALVAAAMGADEPASPQPAAAQPAPPATARPAARPALVDPFQAPRREKPNPAGQSQPAPGDEAALRRGASPVEEDQRELTSHNRWGPEASFTADARRETGQALDHDALLPRRRFAIAIGIDNYAKESGFAPLHCAAGDAVAVADALLSKAKFDQVLLIADRAADEKLKPLQDQQRLTVSGDVTRRGIRDQVEQFIVRANRFDDVLVFYFAGHGDSDRTAFLVPGDYDASAPKPLTLSEVLEWMVLKPVRARNKLIILDACRSAPNDARGRVMAKAFRDTLVQPGERLTILTGCDASQSSLEDGALQHGRFTWALLDALQGNGYKPGEEHLLVSHLYEHVLKTFHERNWRQGQSPQQFATGPIFSLAYRAVPRPAPLDEFEWDLLRRAHEEAHQRYLAGELERASAAYRFALRASSSTPLKDEAVRQEHGQLLLERALTVYRLGLKDEARELRAEGTRYSPEASVLLELEGYDLADAGQEREAVTRLEAAIERSGEATPIDAYLWSRKAALEESLGEYSAATVSYGQAALASLRAGDKQSAERWHDQMRRIDFELAWLDQSRLTGQPRFGLEAATASFACSQKIYGPEHWRTRSAQVKIEALTQQSRLPWPQLQTILELESLYIRLNNQDRDVNSLPIAQLLSEIEVELHGSVHPWCANSFANIAGRLRDLGRHGEAAAVYRQAVESYRRHYGDKYPSTIECGLLLAGSLRSAGETSAADEALRDAARYLDDLLPILNESSSASAKSQAGKLLYRARRYQEATSYFAAATTAYEANQQLLDAAWMRSWQSDCYRELKQDAQTVALYQSRLAGMPAPAASEESALDAANLAKALHRLERYPEALEQFAAAAATYEAIGDPADAAWMEDWSGSAQRKLKRGLEAVKHYDRGLATFRKLDRPGDAAQVLYNRANAYFESADYERGIAEFEQSMQACDASSLPITAGWSESMRGLCQMKLGRSRDAIASYRAALDRFSHLKHNEDIAPIHELLGQTLSRARRYSEALPHFEAAVALNAAAGRSVALARDHAERAKCLRGLNQEEKAIAAYEEGLKVCADALIGGQLSQADRVQLVFQRGVNLYNVKRYDQAVPEFELAAQAYGVQSRPVDVAWMHSWIGDCHVGRQQDEPAAAAYAESLRRFTGVADSTVYASVFSNLGQALYRLKKYPEAIVQFELAKAAFERAKNPSEVAWSVGWIGDCRRDAGDDEAALAAFQDCVARFEELKEDAGLAPHATRLAGVLIRMGRNDEALAPCQAAAKAYERLKNDAMAARLYMEYARTFQRLQRYEEALPAYDFADERYEKISDPLSRAFISAWKGQCLQYLGRDDDARDQYQRTIEKFSRLEHQTDLSTLIREYAKLLKAAEKYDEAIVQFQAAAKEFERGGKKFEAAWMLDWIGGCYRDSQRDEEAVTAFQAALAVFTNEKNNEGIAEEGYDLGQALYRLKRYSDALPPLAAAAEANDKLDQPGTTGEVRLLLGDAYLALSKWEPCAAQYDLAVAAYHKAKLPAEAAEAANHAGRALLKSGRKEDARRYLIAARRAYQDLQDTDKAEEVERAIAELDGK